ncbi:hypothetical protein T11_4061 [Trichinella zimbabwensis]|uniref:Uncharacterized protein n=1 Tax=Trichinella zimbabwensis TaxID=268475 RepID=A0A0V1I891_9BILA|nr:hypothetical protein T11_4061 [Trichinella zimbabwensis]
MAEDKRKAYRNATIVHFTTIWSKKSLTSINLILNNGFWKPQNPRTKNVKTLPCQNRNIYLLNLVISRD